MSISSKFDPTIYRDEALSAYGSHFAFADQQLLTMPSLVTRGFLLIILLAVCFFTYGIVGRVPVTIKGPAVVKEALDGRPMLIVEMPSRYRYQVHEGMPLHAILNDTTVDLVVGSIEYSELAHSSAVFYVTSSLSSHSQAKAMSRGTVGTAVIPLGTQRALFLLWPSLSSRGED